MPTEPLDTTRLDVHTDDMDTCHTMRRPAKPARVIPWDAMTRQQQNEHMLSAHNWSLSVTRWDDDSLTGTHSDDHTDFRSALGTFPHTHDKPTRD